ncbi:MAG: 30S ribosomal protein S4 [Candidatus Micrarchaeota archaeon]
MGHPPRRTKRYEKPKKLWDATRIKEEKAFKLEYGLKNMRELWKMQTILRKVRREARRLLSRKGSGLEKRTEQLLNRVKSFLVSGEVSLDDILTLTERDILNRRLQTIVVKRGLAKTPGQARQFIVHGHIAVAGQKVNAPSYLVKFDEEKRVDWFKHPIKFASAPASAEEDEAVEENGVETSAAEKREKRQLKKEEKE